MTDDSGWVLTGRVIDRQVAPGGTFSYPKVGSNQRWHITDIMVACSVTVPAGAVLDALIIIIRPQDGSAGKFPTSLADIIATTGETAGGAQYQLARVNYPAAGLWLEEDDQLQINAGLPGNADQATARVQYEVYSLAS
jgi:hypothetical protein